MSGSPSLLGMALSPFLEWPAVLKLIEGKTAVPYADQTHQARLHRIDSISPQLVRCLQSLVAHSCCWCHWCYTSAQCFKRTVFPHQSRALSAIHACVVWCSRHSSSISISKGLHSRSFTPCKLLHQFLKEIRLNDGRIKLLWDGLIPEGYIFSSCVQRSCHED